MRNLNILQLINVRWYNACAYYAITLSYALKRRGHKVIVAADPKSPPILEAQKLGLEVYEDLYLSHTSPGMIVYNIKRMADLIKRENIDIINAHRGEGHLVVALYKYILKKKIPLIRTRGDTRPPKDNIFNRYLNNNLTDLIIVTAETLRGSYLQNLKIKPEKVSEISVGIDEIFFSPRPPDLIWRNRLNISEGDLVVGMVGRLSPVKGHKYFIQAAEFVLKKIPQAKFIIAGENAQIKASQLKEKVKESNMENNFRFVGKVNDIREIISVFDVGVVASVGSETICRVLLEYMAMGKPVVGTSVNAIPEVIQHGTNGFVVPPGDKEALGEAILQLLEDKEKRINFGNAGRSSVEKNFSLEQFAKNTEEVYFELLK
ncbi:MAG: glycosyltransferase family 4 protein [candidate division Zixibacteria bacterium]|nr:glycosyltransferase family 4 protein [candidate division Zixibacteria bacterium]